MAFDQREWVNDMVVSTVATSVGGAVLAMIVPGSTIREAALYCGLGGLVTGMLGQPLKWILNQRPDAPPEDDDDQT